MKPEELFRELKSHLELLSLLPDEYFKMNSLPCDISDMNIEENYEIFPQVTWGESEGIFIDVYLRCLDGDNKLFRFITGKTLGEREADFDRMNCIAGEIYKYANGSDGQYARYSRFKKGEEGSKKQAFERIDELLRKKMYYASVTFHDSNPMELGLLLIIYNCLWHLDLPEEKWRELSQSAYPLKLLFDRCQDTLKGTIYEITDSLESCREIEIKEDITLKKE